MPENKRNTSSSLIEMAGDIVSAYVSNNSIPPSELAKLICCVHDAVTEITGGASTNAPAEIDGKATPAQIRDSITPDALISFIDGNPYRSLKRHLTAHGLDPRSYRERYGLPSDYPMVAQGYSEERSQIAKAISLGIPRPLPGHRRTSTSGRKTGRNGVSSR
ncbi:MucR family transcriptional regulator [Methylobacterium sp. DB1607]|nr:MucR family transcriptional regulator [Methylobacterium sp. DB1607]